MVEATKTTAAAAGTEVVEVFKPAAAAVKKSEEATVVSDSSEDDEIEPAQDAIRAAKSSLGGKHFEHVSDEDSYLSESSEEDNFKTAADAKANLLQFSSSDEESDPEELVVYRPRMSAHPRPFNSSLPRVTDEWSSVKDVPLTEIGSRKGSELIIPLQQKSKLALGYEERTYSQFNGVDEKSKLMAAAQAAAIPSDDDNFGADSDNVSPRARASSRSMSRTVRSYSSETSTRVIPTPSSIPQYHEEVDSDKGSSLLSDDESESSIFDDESDNEDDQHQPTNAWRNGNEDDMRKDCRSLYRNGVYSDEGEDDFDENEPVKKANKTKGNANSSSFSAQSRKFNWADVKSKIFYSFRALKASSGSDEEGSRTIFVKNLAREVTHDMLYEIFQEVGSITNVRITGAAGRSEVGSAYVDFESGADARKAVQQKNGKMLEGRMIACDIAYESTRTAGDGVSGSSHGGFSGSSHGGAGSVSGSSHGKMKQQSGLSRADSAPILGRKFVDHQSGLKLFDPKIQEGDAKFLSCFNDPAIPYGHCHPPPPGDALSRSFRKERRSGGSRDVAFAHVKPSHGYTHPGNFNDECKSGGSREVTFAHFHPPPPGYPLAGNSKKGPKTGGSTDLALAPCSRSYGNVLSAVDKSVLCSERNAVGKSPLANGLKSVWPWRRVRKSKWGRFLMPWRRSKLQWWQFAELSAAKVARGQGLENHRHVDCSKGEAKRPKQLSVRCSC